MLAAHGRILKVFGILSTLALALTLAAPTFAAGRHARATYRRATYANAPVGVRDHHAMRATVTGLSGNVLRLALHSGVSLSVTVLPSAIVERNGRASSLAQIASGDAMRMTGGRFVGVFTPSR